MTNDMRIKGFISTSLIDWPGKICSIIFLAGCGFRCPACHNGRLVLEPDSIPDYPLEDILNHLRSHKQWIDGVTVTGGEPTIRRGLPDLLAELRDCGVRIKLDTNGSNPSMLNYLVRAGLIDAVYMDVKAPLASARYSRVAGVAVDTRVIRRSIEILKSSGLEVAFRTTVIPGLVEEPELESIRQALGTVRRFIVQAFRSRETLNPAFESIEEFTIDRVEAMRSRFEVPAAAPAEADSGRFARVG